MEDIVNALVALAEPARLGFLVLGVVTGMVVGILPGLGGIAGLSLLLPFVYGMDPISALAMMVGLVAPTTTSDTFPAVLMGIPGTAGSQATVMDGFPLAQKGEGARALGAAFTASLLGGVFGAVVLTGAVFVAKPIILSIGFAEQMALVVFALTMIGLLTGDSFLKGLGAGVLGLLIGSIGTAPATGETRMAFGNAYLIDGIPIVLMGLGLFAIPEIVDLLRRSGAISESGKLGHGWLRGFMDTMRNKFLVLRCSVIGCIVGALPGLGGSVVDWIAYGHVVQSTKSETANFGKGDIRGVIAPESANNAKEGGALIPTLLFGIPGSGSMAILLGGLIVVGIRPGPDMVVAHLDLTYTIIWSLALANVIGAILCLIVAGPVTRLTTIRYALLAPCMIIVILFAAFQATRGWGDLLTVFVLGVLGVGLKRFDWPRSALLIGFFLAPQIEASTYQTIQIYGWGFFRRPIVLAILVLTALTLLAGIRMVLRNRARAKENPRERGGRADAVFTLVIIAFTALVMADGLSQSYLGAMFPVAVSAIGLLLTVPLLGMQFQAARQSPGAGGDAQDGRRILEYLLWIASPILLSTLIGFPLAAIVFALAFLTVKAGDNVIRNLLITLGILAVLSLLSASLGLQYPTGLLHGYVDLPWWLGG